VLDTATGLSERARNLEEAMRTFLAALQAA
jgi:hypothetical protein